MMHVHESKLTMSSDFLKNALKGEWQEAATRMVELPDCDPDNFIVYAEWLYTGRMCTIAPGDYDLMLGAIKERATLSGCYALGSFLQDSDFRDAVIDALVDMVVCNNFTYTVPAKVVYDISSSKSPHRKLAVDFVVHCWSTDRFITILYGGHPAEYLTDLVVATGSKLRETVSIQSVQDFFAGVNLCQYHEHTVNNTPCYKTRFTA
jgi:hypothetical protein